MHPKGKGKRKVKINLVFNEEKRREFLTGFRKRKLERRNKAKEKLEQELKAEKKRLKAEARESYKKLIKSHAPIPEVEDLLAEEYEDENVTVKVVELSATEIAKKNNWIGPNQPVQEETESEQHQSDESKLENEVPGMELRLKPSKSSKEQTNPPEIKKDIKKILRKQATKNVQKSKAFQMKNKVEQQKQKKKALQRKKRNLKLQNKVEKKKSGRGKH